MIKPINIFGICMAFLLAFNIAHAASITVNSPYQIIESESASANFTVNSTGFNGTVYLLFTNINSSISSVNFTNSDFSGDAFSYSWSIVGLQPGTYSIFANLTNSSRETLATINKTGIVNSSIPRVLASLPSGTLSKDSAVLSVTTNEIATCKYGTTNDSFENLSNTFSNTKSTSHNQTLSGLSQGEHTFYVRCQDSSGYSMNESAIIKFAVDLPPSAQIILSDASPVKASIIEITLATSENIENTPILEYSFNDNPASKRQISLAGSNANWKGYLIITEVDDNKIGTFYFTATDSVGNSGTKITAGNIFVVDNTKPGTAQSIKASSEFDGSIKLSWYYDGEEADYFNVYRSTTSGINYVDYYAKSNGSTRFVDRGTIDKVTYYYKISTTDKAGNEGPLSEEVYATSVNKLAADSSSIATAPQTQEAAQTPKVLPPNLVPRVDTSIKQIDKLLIDVKDASSQLEANRDPKRSLIQELRLAEKVNASKSGLEILRDSLEGFKSVYATEQELEQKLHEVELEAKKIEKTTPKDVNIVEKSEFLQSISKDDIEKATSELFSETSLNPEEKKDYINKNLKEKDKIKVSVDVKIISIEFLDGTKETKSYIKKKLSYDSPKVLNDVLVIEFIPKSIAQNTNEIDFSGQKYDVIKDDPIVKFGFLKFNYEGEEISYTLNKKINPDEAKNAKSVVLLSPNELVKKPNELTGFSLFPFSSLGLSKSQSLFILIGLLVIIALIVYYLLFVKGYIYIFKKISRAMKLKKMESSLSDDLQELPELPSTNRILANDGMNENMQLSDENANKLLNELYFHIKDAKADLSDRLMPLFVMINSKLEAKGMRSNSKGGGESNILFINALIEQTHKYLDENLYNEAVKLYPQINFMYQNLPKEHKSEIYERCAELRKRINNLKPIF